MVLEGQGTICSPLSTVKKTRGKELRRQQKKSEVVTEEALQQQGHKSTLLPGELASHRLLSPLRTDRTSIRSGTTLAWPIPLGHREARGPF